MQQSKKHLFISLLLPFQVLLVQYISQKPAWVEYYYSTGIYPKISLVLRFLLGWVPFSIGDILGLALLLLLLRGIYLLIKQRFRNFIGVFLKLTTYLSVIYFLFYAFWGLNYFREPLAKNLGLEQSKYSTEQLITSTEIIIEKLNQIHCRITDNDTIEVAVPYATKEMYSLAPNGFKTITQNYPQLTYSTPSIKNSFVSLFQSYNGTSGYLNPITGEAQVNDMIPKTGYPATTCHEMAHQIGWSAENDANFVGFLASINNPDIYFQYSGYRMAYRYAISEIYKRDKELWKTMVKTVNKGIRKDLYNTHLHWKQFKNPIEPYLKKGYNSYLKANNQAQGIKSYSYVVDLLIAYFEKQTAKNKIK